MQWQDRSSMLCSRFTRQVREVGFIMLPLQRQLPLLRLLPLLNWLPLLVYFDSRDKFLSLSHIFVMAVCPFVVAIRRFNRKMFLTKSVIWHILPFSGTKGSVPFILIKVGKVFIFGVNGLKPIVVVLGGNSASVHQQHPGSGP